MLKTICQIMFICCIPMVSGKENVAQEYVSYIENCIELENFERQEYSAIEGKYIADTETLLEVQKELAEKGGFPSYIRLERLNGLDIYTLCIYIPGEKNDGEESYEEEFLIILNGTWEGQEVCWQYVTFPATGSIYDSDLISYQYLKYPPYDEYAAMKADVNFDGCADLLMRESIPQKASHSWEYHGIIWKAELGKFVWYESFPEQVSHVQLDKQRMIYHRDSDSEWGVEYITEYRVINGEYAATRELVWNEKEEIVFYYEMGVLIREHPNMGYTDKYELYPDLNYWWKG